MFTIRATQTPPQFHIFCNPLSVQNPCLRFFQNFWTQNPVKFNFAIPRLFCYKFFCVRWSTESARRGIYIRSAGSWSLSVRTIPPGSAPGLQARQGRKKRSSPRKQTNAEGQRPQTAASRPAPEATQPADRSQQTSASARSHAARRPQTAASARSHAARRPQPADRSQQTSASARSQMSISQSLRSSRPPRAGGKERAGSGRPGRISLNPTARSRRSRKNRIYARKNPFAHR